MRVWSSMDCTVQYYYALLQYVEQLHGRAYRVTQGDVKCRRCAERSSAVSGGRKV